MTDRPTAEHPAAAESDESLTVPEVCEELKIPKATFYYWRQTNKGPLTYRLPNGGLRVDRTDLMRWKQELKDAA
jgi:Helix-turn-helix domain